MAVFLPSNGCNKDADLLFQFFHLGKSLYDPCFNCFQIDGDFFKKQYFITFTDQAFCFLFPAYWLDYQAHILELPALHSLSLLYWAVVAIAHLHLKT